MSFYCKKCNHRLSHLWLKEMLNLFQGDSYKIECAQCNHENYLTRDEYVRLREISRKKEKIEHETLKKLPHEFNLLMINAEKCGNSWLAGHISELYYRAYNILPKWNHEISRLWAVSKKYPLPRGWNSVYYVDPKEALERDYDKILILQKDLNALQRDILLYYRPEALLERDYRVKYKEYFKRIEKWWNVMYGQDFNDLRVLKVRLENVNNHTEYAMNKILNFLEIPEFNRLYPMAVNRNWQVYSDIVPEGYELCDRLIKIQEIYEGQTVNDITLQSLAKREKLKYKYINDPNPYCRAKEENSIEVRSFRLTPDNDIKDVLEVVKY